MAKGRSMLRAYIEDTGEYLSHLLSMYPKLFEQVGIPYAELLDKLINFALDK